MFDNNKKTNSPSLIGLVDDIDEHLNKSMALGAMLSIDHVLFVDKKLVEYYFGQIQDELWEVKQAWQQLSERIQEVN